MLNGAHIVLMSRNPVYNFEPGIFKKFMVEVKKRNRVKKVINFKKNVFNGYLFVKPEDKSKAIDFCDKVKINPNWLMSGGKIACVDFLNFDPSKLNLLAPEFEFRLIKGRQYIFKSGAFTGLPFRIIDIKKGKIFCCIAKNSVLTMPPSVLSRISEPI
jgi:transcription antitermination factor NusG